MARTSPIGGGLLVIRGSKPGDSLVYLDSEPIPLLFHFGALSSTVNPDLVEAIDFIPGNFSARYGASGSCSGKPTPGPLGSSGSAVMTP